MIPSVSALPRAFRCKSSFLLTQVQRSHSTASQKGTQVHRFLEDAGRIGRDAALEAVTDESARLLCEALDLGRLPLGDGVSWAAEVAYSLSLTTGISVEVGRGIGRAYPADGGLHGTADLVALSQDGETAFVLDAKTGHGWLPAAGESEQLKALALMACRAHGASRAKIGHLHLRDDGTPWTDWADMDAFDLDVFAAELKAVLATKEAQPVEGEHCRYCNAFAHCPAKARLAVTVGLGAPAADLSALTPEIAAQAWVKAKAYRALLHEVEHRLEEYARESPLTLADGMMVGPVESSRDELDGEVVFASVAKAYGSEVAKASVELAATKKSIDRAMRAVQEEYRKAGDKQTLKALNDSMIEVVRKAGGLTTKTKVVVREYRPKI